MTTIVEQIKEANYLISEEQVEQLAQLYIGTARALGDAQGSYFKVLLAALQAKLGTARKKYPNLKEAQIQQLDQIHEKFYAAVMRGVTTEEVTLVGADELELRKRKMEIHRRAVFARTAKSTIHTYIDTGGDVRKLDINETSKAKLRKEINEAKGTPSWNSVIEVHRTKIEKVCSDLAKSDPGQARDILESVLSHIQGVLDNLPGRNHGSEESTVIFTAVDGASVEVPQDFSEPAEGVGHIPEIHEFQEVSAA